jgi:hypothetical protein
MNIDKDIVDFTTDEVITTTAGTFGTLFISSLQGNKTNILLHFNTLIHYCAFVMRFIN